jgi:dihydroxy-acid dehydratase
VIGHIAPEAQVGGPIAFVKDGDLIKIDSVAQRIDMLVSAEELAERQTGWKERPLRHQSGVLYKFAKLVSSAARGAMTDRDI